MELLLQKIKHLDKKQICFFLAIMLTPLAGCELILFLQGMLLQDLSLLTSQCNDEVAYYLQISGILKYGHPLGYWGYNEGHALHGTLSAWSPALYVLQIIYGKVFGWTYNYPVYSNILWMTVAMGIFALVVKPDARQTTKIVLLYLASLYVSRYVVSGMAEPSVYSITIITVGFIIGLNSNRESNFYKTMCLYGTLVFLFFLCLMRPYFVVLYLFPLFFCINNRSKKTMKLMAIITLVVAAFNIVLYMQITSQYTASYFTPLINWDWLRLLISNPKMGLVNLRSLIGEALNYFFQNIGTGVANGNYVGAIYLIYLLMTIIYFCRMVTGIRAKSRKDIAIYGVLFVSMILLFVACATIYDLRVGSRHMTAFTLMGIFFICADNDVYDGKKQYILLILACMWLCFAQNTSEFDWKLPKIKDGQQTEYLEAQHLLDKKGLVNENASEPWENTVDFDLDADWHDLYAMPDGVGIQFCMREYLEANLDNLKAGYLCTKIDSEIDERCEEKGLTQIAEYGNVRIWDLQK